MKKTTIFAVLLTAALLTGCGEDKPLDNTSSSSSSTASSSSSSSSSIASSSSSSSTSSSTASSSSVAESSTSNPEPTQSSSTTTTPEPTQSSSTPTSTTPEPTQSSSTPTSTTTSTSTSTTSTPTPEPKPTPSSTSSTFSSQPTTDPVTKYWNPDAPGNKPGPYGGYYDAGGNLHCILANMPMDKGYPSISFYDEYGDHYLTYAEKEKAREEERRISAGGLPDLSYIDWDAMP